MNKMHTLASQNIFCQVCLLYHTYIRYIQQIKTHVFWIILKTKVPVYVRMRVDGHIYFIIHFWKPVACEKKGTLMLLQSHKICNFEYIWWVILQISMSIFIQMFYVQTSVWNILIINESNKKHYDIHLIIKNVIQIMMNAPHFMKSFKK